MPVSPANAALWDEVIRLGRPLLNMVPAKPKLMLILHSRQQARFDVEGALILLGVQDRCR